MAKPANAAPVNEQQTLTPVEVEHQTPAPAPAEEQTPATDSEGFTILVMIPVYVSNGEGGEDLLYATQEFANKTAIQKALDLAALPEGTKFLRGKYLKAKVETKTVVTF